MNKAYEVTNIYIFGSSKFIKESVQGFDPKQYRISSTDNPELFKIQLSKERDPNSIILIDKNKIENGNGIGRLNPFRDKNKIGLDFIKEHPLLNNEISTVNVETYGEVSRTFPQKTTHVEKKEEAEKEDFDLTSTTTQEETMDTLVENDGLEEEFDLEALLANGIETNDEDETTDDEEDFDLEALIASETAKKEEDEDFDLEALIASETAKREEGEEEEIEEEEEDFDLEALIASETAKKEEKKVVSHEEKTETMPLSLPETTEEDTVEKSVFEGLTQDPRIMLPEEITSELLNLISKLLKGHEIDVNINITSHKKDKKRLQVSTTELDVVNDSNLEENIETSTTPQNEEQKESESEEDFEKMANEIINSKQKEVEDFAKETEAISENTEKESEMFSIETLIADVDNITSRFKNETSETKEKSEVKDESNKDENPVKKKTTKTAVQNMMEHLSEDEIAEMVLKGKL